jgi:enoyl-CoA hydratase/carnithine racemase
MGTSHGIRYEVSERVVTITLDRRDDANRLTHEMAAALVEACEEAEDSDAAAVVLRGAGPWFCAGLAGGVTAGELRGKRNPVEAVAGIGKPVVVVLCGPAVGAGAELALAGDLRVATEPVTFSFQETAASTLPVFGATQRLPRLVGRARGLEILLLGRPVTAPEALAIGLVSRVVPADGLETAVADLVGTLLEQGPLALRLAKEAVRRAADLSLADGLHLEEDLYVLLQTTADRAEGVRSFMEKRRPRFRGR